MAKVVHFLNRCYRVKPEPLTTTSHGTTLVMPVRW
jgi:hypothetical protein